MTLPIVRLCAEDDAEGILTLRKACHESGFFYLVDSIDESVCQRCADAARDFFENTPSSVKESMSYEDSPAFRGYMRMGVENTAGIVDQREQVELGPCEEEAPRDDGDVGERLRGPNRWSSGGTTTIRLREATEAWLEACRQVSEKLVRLMALALGLSADGLRPAIGSRPHYQAKLAYYRASSGSVGAHTDSGLLTLLWQDASGLEVFADGAWTEVAPLERSLVCNIGEMLQLATGNYFLATPHRVRAPNKSRLSLPYFWNPSLDVVVDFSVKVTVPWSRESSNPSSTPLLSESTNNNRMIQAYGHNAFKSLARSHPRVFAKHHPDLRLLSDGTIEKK